MPASLVDGASILVLEIGNATTHAILFDVVEGRYRFVAIAEAASTIAPPLDDVSLGVYQAVKDLETKTGQHFIDETNAIITPSTTEGYGVDQIAVTLSAGPDLKIALAGLLEDVSVESARRLANTLYGHVVEILHVNDKRPVSQQIDHLAQKTPDVIIVTGGTENGATQSLDKLFETIGLGAYLASTEKQPQILYAGNQALAENAQKLFASVAEEVHIAPNLRPDIETENLLPAAKTLAKAYPSLMARHIHGIDHLNTLAGGNILPVNYAQLRIIRLLGAIYNSPKGVLNVDLGANHLSMAAAYRQAWQAQTFPWGSGLAAAKAVTDISLPAVMRWLPIDIPENEVLGYLLNKQFYPQQIPGTKENLAIEQALAKAILQAGVKDFVQNTPREAIRIHHRLLPLLEPIFVSGAVLLNTASAGQTLLALLDGLQPVGVTTFVLDENNLLAALGVIAETNSLLPAQVLETGAFTNLATVIAPISSARTGVPILQIKMTDDSGTKTETTLKQGSMEILPLPLGHRAELEIKPQRNANAGFGPGRGRKITISGSLMGLIIDGRGRPLVLPEDPIRRRELLNKWLWVLGG